MKQSMHVSEKLNSGAAKECDGMTMAATTIVHVFSGDLWAGAERMIHTLLNGLSRDKDLKIIAVAFNEGTLTERLRLSGVETFVVDEAMHGVFAILTTARALLRGRNIQLVHAHGYKANLLAWMLARSLGGSRLVSTVHSLPEAAARNSVMSRLADALKRVVDTLILRHAFSHVVAVSRDIMQVLIRRDALAPEAVGLIYNGIDCSPDMRVQTSAAGGDVVHIGTVGRMMPVKDFPLFLKVAAELQRHAMPVRFSMLGDGPMKKELAQLVQALGLSESFQFVAPRPDPLSYYQSLDIYLNTSIHEGLPLSLLEAMACGKPVVAPAVGGIPEILCDGEQGFLVTDRDVSSFMGPCMRLVRDSALRRTLGNNAAARVAGQFSSAQMTASYRQLYTRLVSGTGMSRFSMGGALVKG